MPAVSSSRINYTECRRSCTASIEALDMISAGGDGEEEGQEGECSGSGSGAFRDALHCAVQTSQGCGEALGEGGELDRAEVFVMLLESGINGGKRDIVGDLCSFYNHNGAYWGEGDSASSSSSCCPSHGHLREIMDGKCLLHCAVRSQMIEIVQAVLSLGCDRREGDGQKGTWAGVVDVNERDHVGDKAVHVAAGLYNLDMVKLLCERGAVLVEQESKTVGVEAEQMKKKEKWKSSHFSAFSSSSFQNGGDNVKYNDSARLIKSVVSGSIELLDFVIQRGFDIYAVDELGQTALSLACSNGHYLMCDFILNYERRLKQTKTLGNEELKPNEDTPSSTDGNQRGILCTSRTTKSSRHPLPHHHRLSQSPYVPLFDMNDPIIHAIHIGPVLRRFSTLRVLINHGAQLGTDRNTLFNPLEVYARQHDIEWNEYVRGMRFCDVLVGSREMAASTGALGKYCSPQCPMTLFQYFLNHSDGDFATSSGDCRGPSYCPSGTHDEYVHSFLLRFFENGVDFRFDMRPGPDCPTPMQNTATSTKVLKRNHVVPQTNLALYKYLILCSCYRVSGSLKSLCRQVIRSYEYHSFDSKHPVWECSLGEKEKMSSSLPYELFGYISSPSPVTDAVDKLIWQLYCMSSSVARCK
eukprot:Nk52_evm19s272 gene=Nk52_evmTU19s272